MVNVTQISKDQVEKIKQMKKRFRYKASPYKRDEMDCVIEELYKLNNLEKPLIFHFSSPIVLELALKALYLMKFSLSDSVHNTELQKVYILSQFESYLIEDNWEILKKELIDLLKPECGEKRYQFHKNIIIEEVRKQLLSEINRLIEKHGFDFFYNKLFLHSPYGFWLYYGLFIGEILIKLIDEYFEDTIIEQVDRKLCGYVNSLTGRRFKRSFREICETQFSAELNFKTAKESVKEEYNRIYRHNYHPFIKFSVDVYKTLGVQFDQKILNLYLYYIHNHSYSQTFQNVYMISASPTKNTIYDPISSNKVEAKISYEDGYDVWFYNETHLRNSKYHCHQNLWSAKWILDEENAEVRRAILQLMGSDRILSELSAEKLDEWKEYTLYKTSEKIDIEDYYVLKMTCPSTGLVHCHRVPPRIRNARDAIQWINHGIDPYDFIKQS